MACFCSQVIGVAVFFALLLKPVAVEENEEIEQLLLGKKNIMQSIFYHSGYRLLADSKVLYSENFMSGSL